MPKSTPESTPEFLTIRVKPGHPTGEYRRSGHVFHVDSPVTLPVDDVTDEMLADAWLIITATDDPNTEPFSPVKNAEASEELARLGDELTAANARADSAEAETAAALSGMEQLSKRLEDAHEELAKLTGNGDTEYLCTDLTCERAQPGNGYKTEHGRDEHVAEKHPSS